MNLLVSLILLIAFLHSAYAQQPTVNNSSDRSPTETQHYEIDIAGIRVGTMTATRQLLADNRTTYTLVSDVKVNLLVYTVKIYYKVTNQFEGKKLMLSTVETRSNRGNFASRTEWKGDHYEIVANQYKFNRQAIERNMIDLPVSSLFFEEPVNRDKAFSEYFGDYFTITRKPSGIYRAILNDREDDYLYEKGKLVKVIKHNSVKNFIVRRIN